MPFPGWLFRLVLSSLTCYGGFSRPALVMIQRRGRRGKEILGNAGGGAMMPITESDLSVEERLVLLLQHLGIQRAHFAARVTRDWNGFVTTHLESVSSLTLVCPQPFDSHVPGRLASRLLVLTGDQGRPAELVRRATTSLTGANFHTLNDYPVFPWSDPAADRTDEIGSAMMEFLEYVDRTKGVETVDLPES